MKMKQKNCVNFNKKDKKITGVSQTMLKIKAVYTCLYDTNAMLTRIMINMAKNN